MRSKGSSTIVVSSGRDRAASMTKAGAAAQLNRCGRHRPRAIPDKRREAERRACRGRRGWE